MKHNYRITRTGNIHRAEVNCEGSSACRPLVLIDPEDREQVERLASGFLARHGAANGGNRTNAMQAALREFANPKPEEPTGHFARVVNGEGATYYLSPAGNWHREDDDLIRPWDQIDAVKVLSEGVTS